MATQLKASIARIYGIDDKVVGAGFLVSETHILTCAHVIAQALGLSDETASAPLEHIQLDFPLVAAGRKLKATVVCWHQPRLPSEPLIDDEEDIAVLELELSDNSALGCRPVRLTDANDVWGHSFRAFGFPPSYDEGVWASGQLLDRQANNWIQVEAESQLGYFITPGFSGTAVLDEKIDGVVGMVVVSDRRPDTRAAFIIPTSALVKVWPALREVVDNGTHQLSGDASETARTSTLTTVEAQKADLAAEKPATSPFWTDFDQGYTEFHRANRNEPNYRPSILLTFLSGDNAAPTWDTLPSEVLSMANIDIDVVSVDYSEFKLTAKRIQAAATDLRILFSTTFADYRQLLFVAQDGDLIIKQMLLDDAADEQESASLKRLHDSKLTCRCGSIVSVSKNHHSGSNKLANEITNAFDNHLARYEMVGLPTPDVFHFSTTFLQGSESPRLRVDHLQARALRSRLPRPLTAYLVERLSPLRSYRATAIARQTISRTFAIDPQVHTLFGNQLSKNGDEAVSPGESQATLLDRLTEAASAPGPESLRVITGGAGVGKSVLLRMVARRLSTIWLRGTARAALPFFFPLSQFKIDVSNPNPRHVWKHLSSEWAAWVNELFASNATEDERSRPDLISIDHLWLHNELRRFPTALILDGVDEFMLNHPALSMTDFASLLRFFRTEYGVNTQFLTIVAIRSSARDATLITESESELLTLRGMAVSEASAIFPSAMKLVGHAADPAVEELLLTPLILSTLEKSNLKLKPEAYLNRAALIHAALTAIIASLKRGWSGTPYSTTAWIDALSLIAWFQYRGLRGEIEDSSVAEFAAGAISEWTKDAGSMAKREVVASFRILLEPSARSTLLRNSIFFPIRESSYRLKHKEWGDYLVSRYAVLCIRHVQFDDLSSRALNHDIYIMAGQQLEENDTDWQTVRALVERSSTDGRFLIVGNFAQMLGDSFAPLMGDVLDQEILGRLHLFPIVVKFAMLSALSSRILLNDDRDIWSKHIKSVLLRALGKYANDEQENALVRSMCWCFLRAMSNTTVPWPGLWNGERESLDTLSMIAQLAGDQFVVNERQRSIQAAFMRIQSYALEIPSRVISTIHYLYPLVLAYNREVPLDRTVVLEIPSLLDDPQLDAVYQDYFVPEVGGIWSRCRELYGEPTAHVSESRRPS